MRADRSRCDADGCYWTATNTAWVARTHDGQRIDYVYVKFCCHRQLTVGASRPARSAGRVASVI